ncbi:hypothetical protein CLV35_3542 [Motilibacter peucedani]|uniref:Uncharacterized protein n=1 Tax=Motilibacter peucedani TaxID=598650 RepID=A0A420XL32_9ACTN|nr:hypothetical protein [Motilibacter peucedani]RKS69364.1 hypothetical protein CLV35_3542 [Motilibacter peucedani]
MTTTEPDALDPELQAAFERVLAAEPPFDRPWPDALDAAVRGGRLRRLRVRAAATCCTAAAVAGAVALAVTVAPDRAADVPVGVPAAPAPVTEAPVAEGPAPDPSAPSGSTDAARLTHVLEQLEGSVQASAAGRIAFDPSIDEAVVVLTTRRGRVEVASSYDAENSLAVLAGSCTAADGRTCTVELSGRGRGAWSRAYPGQGSRADLQFAATAADGRLLLVHVTNLVEVGGAKVLGPTWSELGLSPAVVELAVEASGALG